MLITRDFIYDPSLLLYLPLWKLDGSSFADRSAYGHLCTVTGAVWTLQGRSFDGNDDYIIITPLPSFVSDQQGTLWVWIKLNTNDAVMILCYSKLSTGAVDEYWFEINAGIGRFRAVVYNNTVETGYQTGDIGITQAEWFFLSWRSDGSNNFLNLNGVDQTLTLDTAAGSWLGDLTTDANQITIGALARSGAYIVDFDGSMGEIGYSNRSLSEAELTNLCNRTKWRYQ